MDTLVRAARSGGRTAAADLRRRPAPPTVVWRAAADGVEDPHDFNAQSPRILAAAAAAFAAITGRFGREVVESLRALLSWLLQPTAGVDSTVAAPPLPPARVAALVKATIGLRPDQVEQLIVFAESGRATPEAVERRARRMLRQRVKLIARTEAARAAAAGQKELWLQAQERGLLPPDQKRVWIATLDDRVRDAHAAMHGQVRGLQEPFIKPGGKLIEPGEEPNCRCGQALDFSEIGVAA